jgi:hypothetical protein
VPKVRKRPQAGASTRKCISNVVLQTYFEASLMMPQFTNKFLIFQAFGKEVAYRRLLCQKQNTI